MCELIELSVHAPVDPAYGVKFDEQGLDYCREVHSHEHLDEIFDLLWAAGDLLVRGSFCDQVFRLVFFH